MTTTLPPRRPSRVGYVIPIMAAFVALGVLATLGLASLMAGLWANPDAGDGVATLDLLLILIGFIATFCAWVIPVVGLILFIVAMTRKPVSHPVWASVGLAVLVACFLVMVLWGNSFWIGQTGGFFSG
jgi:hypothetical protein